MNVKFFSLPAFPAAIREFFPRQLVLSVLAAVCFILAFTIIAYADDGTTVPGAEASIVGSILTTVMPIIVLLVSTLGPVAGTYIVAQIIGFLGITNQTKKLDVEAKLREVLHFCAENALKFAYAKAGVPVGSALSPAVIADALFYIKDKNPDTVAALGVTDADLTHILLSKVADFAPWLSMKATVASTDAPPAAATPAVQVPAAGAPAAA